MLHLNDIIQAFAFHEMSCHYTRTIRFIHSSETNNKKINFKKMKFSK